MEELVENLRVIKPEQQNASPSSECSSSNIKERLNLHVKRRLLQETSIMPFAAAAHSLSNPSNDERFLPSPTVLKSNSKIYQKEPPKARRPYQRREKAIKPTTVATNVSSLNRGVTGTADIPSENITRKRRQKTKNQIEQKRCSSIVISTDTNAADVVFTATPLKEMRSEDDVSHDGMHEFESRASTARDKDKWPDILGMVISMKRRELLQDPTVQSLFRQIMGAIKG